MARPKGPAKRKVMLSILESAYLVVEEKAKRRGMKVPTYLADSIERQAALAEKNEVIPRVKGGGK